MGQQGKFLLNKVPHNMVWKYHLVNKFQSNKLYFKAKIIHQILVFLFKNDVTFLYFIRKKKKYNLGYRLNNYDEIRYYVKKKIRSFMRKILYTQVRITRYKSWLILNIILYTTFKKKRVLERKAQETYFRFRHLYYYLTPSLNNFS